MSRMNPIEETLRQRVLRFYNLEHVPLFADGAEAEVYVRDDRTLLKLYTGGNHRATRLESLQDFYTNVMSPDIPLPTIQDVRVFPDENIVAVIETRLKGQPLESMLERLQGTELERAENLYLDAIFGVQTIQMKKEPLRYLLIDDDNLSARGRRSFEVFYADSLREKLREVSPFFASYDEHFPVKSEALVRAIEAQSESPLSVVHGDLFAGNILVNETLDRVEGIIDFGRHTQFGNALLDIASGFGYYRMYAPNRNAIRAAMLPKVLERLSAAEHPLFFQFLLANAILTSNLYTSNPDPRENGHFQWALNIISEEAYWEGALSQ
jgi:hypothetical protein